MICENCGMLTKPFNDGSCEFCGQSVTKPSNNLKNFQPHDNRGDSGGVESDRAKEVEAILAGLILDVRDNFHKSLRLTAEATAALCDLIMRAEVEALEDLKRQATRHIAIKINQSGVHTDTEDERLAVPVKKIDSRINELRGEQ